MKKSGLAILVVEDDKYISAAFKTKFESEGFRTEVAFNGVEAIEKLKSFVPDVIILDIVMPVKSGFEVLEEIRRERKFDHVRIIVATNLGQESHVLRCREYGVEEYIVKSELSLSELVGKIRAKT